MPNWCNNELIVIGDSKELKRFKREVKTKDRKLSLAVHFPEPDYNEVKVKPTFPEYHKEEFVNPKEAWWDWRIQNWGTKWDIGDVELTEDDDGLCYVFDSAWSPPIGWLQRVALSFPKLKFKLKYREDGMGFKGLTIAEGEKFVDKASKL